MPISQEELRQRPLTPQLILMEDESGEQKVFAVLVRFPCGLNQVWSVPAPATPIDDDWIRRAMQKILESIVADLREGRSEPGIKRNKQAWREFDSVAESFCGALQSHLVTWARKRRDWARALQAPIVVQ
jgi:hypothetical protein